MMQNKRLSGESLMKWYERIISNFSKNYSNKKSARDLGWDPNWFGEPAYTKNLSNKIARYQQCYVLEVTGVVDIHTHEKFMKFARVINKFYDQKP